MTTAPGPLHAASTASAARPARRTSLVQRLTVLNLAVLAVTLIVTFALLAMLSWTAARERQMRAAEISAGLLANSLAPMIVFQDGAAAQSELNAFAQREDLLQVRVLGADGRVFVQWQSPKLTVPLDDDLAPGPTQAQAQIEQRKVHVWVPILVKGERVGTVLLRESLESLERNLLKLTALSSVFILLVLIVAARALRTVQRRALAPIVELSALADQVAQEQNYGLRARVRRPDEVGRLAERFNTMLKRIEAWERDLNQKLRMEQEAGQHMQELAHRDSLTQLPNRLFFQAELQRRVAEALSAGELMALMFIDLDNFKTVNDSHGHDAGDEVLRVVSKRMSHAVRSGDVLCRLGGDEFALILPQLPNALVAEQLALRLIAAVREPLHVDGVVMPVGATVGLAFCPVDASTAPELLNMADAAMYAAKRAGKNTYRRAGHGEAH